MMEPVASGLEGFRSDYDDCSCGGIMVDKVTNSEDKYPYFLDFPYTMEYPSSAFFDGFRITSQEHQVSFDSPYFFGIDTTDKNYSSSQSVQAPAVAPPILLARADGLRDKFFSKEAKAIVTSSSVRNNERTYEARFNYPFEGFNGTLNSKYFIYFDMHQLVIASIPSTQIT